MVAHELNVLTEEDIHLARRTLISKRARIICCLLGAVFLGAFTSVFKEAVAQQVKSCTAAEVLSVKTINVSEEAGNRSARPGPLELTIEGGQELGKKNHSVVVVATGPRLETIDSNNVRTDVACTSEGVVLTAVVTRAVNRSALANIFWRPRLEILLVPHQTQITFKVIWRMRRDSGEEIDLDRNVHPDQAYPVTLMKIIRKGVGAAVLPE